MKKYLFGFFATILAIVFSAYSKPAKMFSTKQFRYASSHFESNDISTLSNWDYDGSSFSCPNGEIRACGIIVDEKYYYIDEEGIPILNATSATFDSPNDDFMVIVAEETSSNIWRVASIGDGTTATSIRNRN